MSYIPPFTALKAWMAKREKGDGAGLWATYDDTLDVLKRFLQPVPVDAVWYKAEYPPVRMFLERTATETASSHFQKHGYFEGRKPFAPGWRGLTAPTPFFEARCHLRIMPGRGRLHIEITAEEFLGLVSNILIAAPVDEAWYRSAYPAAADAIDSGQFPSAVRHFAARGYFDGCLPFAIPLDEAWYTTHYAHVRTGLERGVAASPQDHFFRLGYHEGCRPSPP